MWSRFSNRDEPAFWGPWVTQKFKACMFLPIECPKIEGVQTPLPLWKLRPYNVIMSSARYEFHMTSAVQSSWKELSFVSYFAYENGIKVKWWCLLPLYFGPQFYKFKMRPKLKRSVGPWNMRRWEILCKKVHCARKIADDQTQPKKNKYKLHI